MALKKNEAAPAFEFLEFKPPPGTRFSIWGSNLRLEFPAGKANETLNWLADELGNAEKAKDEASRAAKTKPDTQKAPAGTPGDGTKQA